MTNGNKKNLFGRTALVFLCTFIGLATLLAILAILTGKGSLFAVGTYFLYGGIIVTIIGFVFINKGGNRGDGYAQSNYMKNNEYFKKVRAQEKPFERVVWAVMLAAISIATIGYFLIRF